MSICDHKFAIHITDNILVFTGARSSFDNLQELASNFAKDVDEQGDHIHLSYIDFEDYEYTAVLSWVKHSNSNV